MKVNVRRPVIDSGPSALVQKICTTIAVAAGGKPVLDVACGSGRNAFFWRTGLPRHLRGSGLDKPTSPISAPAPDSIKKNLGEIIVASKWT